MRMMSYVAIVLASLSPVAAFAQPAAPISENSLYIYRANVVDVHDANSITVDVDLGFYIWLHKREFRLYGINAPEVAGMEKAEGERARDFLKGKILAKEVIIQSIKNPKEEEQKEKSGEFLAIVWLDGINLNELLVKEGYAKPRD
jgi:micrococcal nuclease